MNTFLKNLTLKLLTKKSATSILLTKSNEAVESVLIIFPENEEDIRNSVSLIPDLLKLKKKITVLIQGDYVRYISNSYALIVKEYFVTDKLLKQIPKQNIKNLLQNEHADLLLNMNRDNEIFSLICTSLISSPVKFGFQKEFSDRFFNLQFASNSPDSYTSYNNFKSYLYKLINL